MKSLTSILEKLSQAEVETFRLFLKNNCRNGNSKKLELFEEIVKGAHDGPPNGRRDVSRQSVYQLKKRLQQELYSFLMLQEQGSNGGDNSFFEMDCHKKLYCFKILLDKGIHDHAYEMLQEVLQVSVEHSLHSIYLEAVGLKNTYFPLQEADPEQSNAVSYEIRELKKSLDRDLYVTRYVMEAGMCLHQDDRSFRTAMAAGAAGIELNECEGTIRDLLKINELFLQGDYVTVGWKLRELYSREVREGETNGTVGLICVELTKVCIYMEDLGQAAQWLERADGALGIRKIFSPLLLELRYVITARRGDYCRLAVIVSEAAGNVVITGSEGLALRWNWFALYAEFLSGNYRQVIKKVNAQGTSVRNKSWLVHFRMLELLSIFLLQDYDWLHYKTDSFRKSFTCLEERWPRIGMVLQLMRNIANGKITSAFDKELSVAAISKASPWHPLGMEIINYCDFISPAMLPRHPQINRGTPHVEFVTDSIV
jgi:hypothetical protein